jgi:predicted nucleic acid-binding protein
VIILDTDVLSALMDNVPEQAVVQWLDRQPAVRDRKGRPIDARDTFIAGIALARRATLATRNVRHFKDLSVPVVDPWHAGRA